MVSISEVAARYTRGKRDAMRVYANPNLTPVERRLAFGRLLAKYHVRNTVTVHLIDSAPPLA